MRPETGRFLTIYIGTAGLYRQDRRSFSVGFFDFAC
jgi:hypothetical protein